MLGAAIAQGLSALYMDQKSDNPISSRIMKKIKDIAQRLGG